jgi:hypothetical protein
VTATVSSLLAAGLGLVTGEGVVPRAGIAHDLQTTNFPRLARGQFHEWHLEERRGGEKGWHPPLTLLTGLALAASGERGMVLWIGRRCWPTFQHLCGGRREGESFSAVGTLRRFTFLDPQTDAERFWAIAEAMRCPAVRCVVADGARLSVMASRRLQLAAESGKVTGLLARPGWELEEPSYAATRWRVSPRETKKGEGSRWGVELHRCRGQQVEQDAPQRWIATWSYQVLCGKGSLHFSPDVGCGPVAAEISTERGAIPA